jgi:hypothetical protein
MGDVIAPPHRWVFRPKARFGSPAGTGFVIRGCIASP